MKVQNKGVQLATRVTEEQARQVTELADSWGMTVSSVIRMALLSLLKTGEPNSIDRLIQK